MRRLDGHRFRPVGLAVLALAFSLLYVLSSPALERQHWDSLEYSYACETRGIAALWGNHPLGHLILCGALRTAQAAGYQGRALPLLADINALVGAATLVVTLVFFCAVGVPRWRALAWMTILGGTYGFWLYAGTADIYALSLLALIGAWAALVRLGKPDAVGAAWLAGLAVGLAVVMHQFNGPLLCAAGLTSALVAGRANRRMVWRRLIATGATGAAVVVVGYAALFALTGRPPTTAGFENWIVGYGADPTYGRSLNAVGAVRGIATASNTLLQTPDPFVTGSWWHVLVTTWACLVSALAGLFGIGVILVGRGVRRLGPIVYGALAQVAVGVPLIVWWAPDHIAKWWLLVVPGFLLVVAAGFEALEDVVRQAAGDAWRERWRLPFTASAAVFATCWVLFGGLVAMRPAHRADPAFRRALDTWASRTDPGDVIIESDLTAHLRFWARRPNAVFLYRSLRAASASADKFTELRATIDAAQREGHAVYYVPGMVARSSPADLALAGVTREDVTRFFEAYGWDAPVFEVQPHAGGPIRNVVRLRTRADAGSTPQER